MVRLSDIPSEEAAHLLSKACDPFDTKPWVAGPPLKMRRVAILTSAGLHRVGDPAFLLRKQIYRSLRIVMAERARPEFLARWVAGNVSAVDPSDDPSESGFFHALESSDPEIVNRMLVRMAERAF